MPKSVPEPKSSLMMEMIMRIIPYPAPFASPSISEGIGLLPRANASIRPMIMQLVIMSPTKTDSCLLTS